MALLRMGSSGDEVARLQRELIRVGFLPRRSSVDGLFGEKTDEAVRRFQSATALVVDGVVGPVTWEALDSTETLGRLPRPLPRELRRIERSGYPIYWLGDHHLVLFGYRSPEREANRFDDLLGVAWTENGEWRIETFPGTTDPGTYWLENPSRVEGTAVLVPDQYRDTWRIDLHAGKYPALCQRSGPVRVYRDGDRDNEIDLNPSTIQSGYFGINIHRSSASGESTQVDRWSAGCQVFARVADFDRVMELARIQVAETGIETFTYTLVDHPSPLPTPRRVDGE